MKKMIVILVVLITMLGVPSLVFGEVKWEVDWLELYWNAQDRIRDLEFELQQTREELQNLERELEEARNENRLSQLELAILRWRMEVDDIHIARLLTKSLGQIRGEIQVIGLEGILENRIEFYEKRAGLNAREVSNPTFEELVKFLEKDWTDRITPKLGDGHGDPERFVCWHFAGVLAFQAREAGIKMEVVTIWFSDETGIAHAINRVETSDRGLIYIEPQNDELVPAEMLEVRDGGGYIWKGTTQDWFRQWRVNPDI